MEGAIFRKESAFVIGNLNTNKAFWEQVILKDHPFKDNLLGRLSSCVQFIQNQFFFLNYVPPEFETFITDMLIEWEKMKNEKNA